ncbi:MAG TPA: SDR family NAD(P)-dependent oxidoreductase [Thermomicrobiales bacterium]|nr:SDR family NAD(P)-dependent oxidoreductase [Thermomicrobiales bacterium]
MRFDGKVALVTGGGRGIGRAAVLRFAREGAVVVVVDRDEAAARAVAAELAALGREALAVGADVADAADCARMVAATGDRFGRLDIVFANAGISARALVAEMDPGDWDRVLATNLRGVFLTCRAAVPALTAAGGGAIVTMSSSMAGWDSSPGGAAYMASKMGVSGLTRSLALQLGRRGIRVNAVCPGIVQTGLDDAPGASEAERAARHARFARRIPLGQVGQPEDVAAAVAFLASDDARHITGALLVIDGGQTLQSWSNAPDGDDYPARGLW